MSDDSVLGNWWFQKNRKIRELAKGHTAPDDQELVKLFRTCSENDLVRIWKRSSPLRNWLTSNGVISEAITYLAHPETAQQKTSVVIHVGNILLNNPYFLKQISTAPVKFLTPSTSTAPDLTKAKSVLVDLYKNLPATHKFIAYAARAHKSAMRWRTPAEVIRHWWYRVRHPGSLHPLLRGRELIKEAFNPELRKAPETKQEQPKENPPPPPNNTSSDQKVMGILNKTPPAQQGNPSTKRSVVRNLTPVFESSGQETPAPKQAPRTPNTLATGFRESEHGEESYSGTPGSTAFMSPPPDDSETPAMDPTPASTAPRAPSAHEQIKVRKRTGSPLVSDTPEAPEAMSEFEDDTQEKNAFEPIDLT